MLVEYTKSARADLKKIDLRIAKRIIVKVAFYAEQENPLGFSSQLKGFDRPTYRWRVGDYRVLFRIDLQGHMTILLVLRIGHRREVYD